MYSKLLGLPTLLFISQSLFVEDILVDFNSSISRISFYHRPRSKVVIHLKTLNHDLKKQPCSNYSNPHQTKTISTPPSHLYPTLPKIHTPIAPNVHPTNK